MYIKKKKQQQPQQAYTLVLLLQDRNNFPILFFFVNTYSDITHIPYVPPLKLYHPVVLNVFMKLCNHHHNQFQNPKRHPILIRGDSPFTTNLSSPWQSPVCFLSLRICLVQVLIQMESFMYFHLLAITNNAALNMGMQVALRIQLSILWAITQS